MSHRTPAPRNSVASILVGDRGRARLLTANWPGLDEPAEQLSALDRTRIEELFREASADRSRAYELKAELDRLGVFQEFEDRFLDLFKSSE